MKNKLNDNKADIRQYEHDAPENFVPRMYKKYALAAAMEVVLPSIIKRPVGSSIPKGKFFLLNCRPSDATNPYATIPISGRGTPGKCKSIEIETLCQSHNLQCILYSNIPVKSNISALYKMKLLCLEILTHTHTHTHTHTRKRRSKELEYI